MKIRIACVCLLAITAGAQANLILNGSFESASVNPGGSFIELATGSTSITNWTVGGNGVDYIGGYWQAAEGNRSLDLSRRAAGEIVAQSFATTAGQSYTVTFAMAGNPDGGPDVKSLRVSAAGLTQDFWFDKTGKTKVDMGWKDYTWVFQATGASTTLGFLSLVDTAYGPALDNVRVEMVQPNGGVVPAPGAIALGMFGLSLVGWVKRRMA